MQKGLNIFKAILINNFFFSRYLTPEDANYNSPLFLDCCALVRQVVHDLREDFGFTLGRWNQVHFF